MTGEGGVLRVVLVCPECGGDAGEHDPLGPLSLDAAMNAARAEHECEP